MGDEVQDRWDAGVEAAWAAFRAELADAIAEVADGQVIEAELGCLAEGQPSNGAAPYVQFVGWGEGLVRAEAVSNRYLDPAYVLEVEDYEEMIELGWAPPTYFEDQEPDHGSDNFWVDAEQREADRLAWMAVQALREVFGVIHPSFLATSGFPEPAAPSTEEDGDPAAQDVRPPTVAYPESKAELQTWVERAVAVLLQQETVHLDADSDIPIRAGDSVLYVSVDETRPAVDVFAQVLVEPEDGDRLAVELDILNRTHRWAKFHLSGDRVVMRHRLVAKPFVPEQLWVVLEAMLDDVDEIADQLVKRVGGLKFLEVRPEPAPEPEEDCPPMAGLLELMRAGRVPSGSVVELFEHDRRELVRMIVAVRTGRRDCRGLDEDDVLDHLRRALDLVARQEARTTRAASRVAAGGSNQQLSLLAPDEVRRAHQPRPRTPRSA
jgi:hypothetical protein